MDNKREEKDLQKAGATELLVVTQTQYEALNCLAQFISGNEETLQIIRKKVLNANAYYNKYLIEQGLADLESVGCLEMVELMEFLEEIIHYCDTIE